MKRAKRIEVMTSPDMFNPDLKQRFNKETGERIDYGHAIKAPEPEIVEPLNEVFTQQLALF